MIQVIGCVFDFRVLFEAADSQICFGIPCICFLDIDSDILFLGVDSGKCFSRANQAHVLEAA